MNVKPSLPLETVCAAFDDDRDRLLDILHAVRREFGPVSSEMAGEIARRLGVPIECVEAPLRYFSAFDPAEGARFRVAVPDDPIARMLGADAIADAVADELSEREGRDGSPIAMSRSSSLGFDDQAPAMRIGDTILCGLTPDAARRAVRELLGHRDASRLVRQLGDGSNAHPLVQSAVHNNIRRVGRMVLRPLNRGVAVRRALSMSPAEVTRSIKIARLRGRGLDSLPTGIKWGLARTATVERVEHDWGELMSSCRDYGREYDRFSAGERRFVICNACDSEPGVFSTRVLLTERADRVFAGMTIAGYAVGAELGIVYLADEYGYLRAYLKQLLSRRRVDGLLGEDILGRRGFRFDIRIHLGSAPYSLGEETAVINACEGRPSTPRPRPPYPTQEGYHGWPTVVHSAETFCCVTKVLEEGPASFAELGRLDSTGTKLLSISGDCRAPGLYELPFGTTVREALHQCGGEDAQAVFISGPHPCMIDPSGYDRALAFDDLATSGGIGVIGPSRDPVRLLADFGLAYLDATRSFCTRHRESRSIMSDLLGRLGEGRLERTDLDRLEVAARHIVADSACGFGRAPARFVLGSIDNFETGINARLQTPGGGVPRTALR